MFADTNDQYTVEFCPGGLGAGANNAPTTAVTKDAGGSLNAAPSGSWSGDVASSQVGDPNTTSNSPSPSPSPAPNIVETDAVNPGPQSPVAPAADGNPTSPTAEAAQSPAAEEPAAADVKTATITATTRTCTAPTVTETVEARARRRKRRSRYGWRLWQARGSHQPEQSGP